MLLKNVNLEEKIQKLKNKSFSEDDILTAVKDILKEDGKKDDEVLKTLSGRNTASTNAFNVDLLETNNIYHIDQIKKMCVDYRLRFLDSRFFKAKLPYEAISKIKQLEKEHGTVLNGFKIMAPSKLFKLENYDDPLLFAPIGNGYYYLIHKWGNDLSPFRKLLAWPFKHFENFVFCVFILSMLLTGLVPDGTFHGEKTSENAGVIFLFMFKSLVAVTLYYGYLSGKNFSVSVWDSKYYNN
ncbi:hypothetical protein BWZ20_03350 [Winogradskyella sp. J14-2]|uniref:hypothetical protein n=1 Tax=Winogradskyella sp. J14-2 TaxID=1936080 RepID=UPI000972DA59|nr:hypothetical protein [Winogradskyella sp. J14-2]APY07394.1 hypothetical protein BWZ20_03350 [Winogradskyella sp. J14-2]